MGRHFSQQLTLREGNVLRAVAGVLTQSYPTLSDSMDCSLPDSSIHGIFQARVLEWVVIAFSCQHVR